MEPILVLHQERMYHPCWDENPFNTPNLKNWQLIVLGKIIKNLLVKINFLYSKAYILKEVFETSSVLLYNIYQHLVYITLKVLEFSIIFFFGNSVFQTGIAFLQRSSYSAVFHFYFYFHIPSTSDPILCRSVKLNLFLIIPLSFFFGMTPSKSINASYYRDSRHMTYTHCIFVLLSLWCELNT